MRKVQSGALAVALLTALSATPASAGLLSHLLGNSSSQAASADASASDDTVTGNATEGTFSPPFAEPTIVVDGKEVATDKRCLKDAEGTLRCKPAAGTIAVLGDGRFVYLNALEGTENVELSIVAEFGEVSVNDQTRVLSLDANDTPSWAKPSPIDGGANPGGRDSETLAGSLPGLQDGDLDTSDNTSKNDGALFCADVTFLADGRMIAVGGTDYYSEPGVDGLPVGLAELEGLKASRIFDPKTNSWSQSGDMEFGRWYPTLVTLANGNIFVASGVTKLLKPVYPDKPLNSGRNVVQTETYDIDSGQWHTNPATAQRSLPLFPRMHLLPNGDVYYDAGGQSFNPFGQSYDQALWNITAAYNPRTQNWTDLAYAGLPLQFNKIGLSALTSALNISNLNSGSQTRLLKELVGKTLNNPTEAISELLGTSVDGRVLEKAIGAGMRGSTFSAMLPLRPDANGGYHRAQFLTAGGVPTYVTVGSPGGYLPISSSRIATVTVNGDQMNYGSRLTGPLNEPRWYGYSVVMPDDSVMVFSGGTRDGVVLPGLEGAIRQAERFDPATETWHKMATAHRMRTYHNTAVLMPDGRILVGGHSPINTAYLSFINLKAYGFADYAGRDPSFEIYTPPYAMRDDRPVITQAPTQMATKGQTFQITVDRDDVDEVVLIRRTATTHIVTADQRSVVLPIIAHNGNQLTVQMTANPAVLPAGPYMLFASRKADDGVRVPSKSTPVDITTEGATLVINQPDPVPGSLDIDNNSTGGPVSPLLPVTDLVHGVTSAIPSGQQLSGGTGEELGVIGQTGRDAAHIGADTVTSLPGATTGLLGNLSHRLGADLGQNAGENQTSPNNQ